jgi:hypothetical protein
MSSVMRFDEWQDSNGVPVLNGAGGGLALGKILQVVSVNKTDANFTTTSTTYLNVTGLSATITPSSTSSKILVMAQITYGGGNNGGGGHFKVVRGGSDVSYLGDATGNSRVRNVFGGSDSGVGVAHEPAFRTWSNPITFVDSPNSTSALTYTVQTRNVDSGAVYVNRTERNTDSVRNSIGASSITLIEVAG